MWREHIQYSYHIMLSAYYVQVLLNAYFPTFNKNVYFCTIIKSILSAHITINLYTDDYVHDDINIYIICFILIILLFVTLRTIVIKKTPELSPPANYTDRAIAACRRS
jgi:hypothetical protein